MREVVAITPSVKLHRTYDPSHLYSILYTAMSTCYDKVQKFESVDIVPVTDLNYGHFQKLLYHCLDSGHTSVIEHVSFCFSAIMSRAASHQLVRHRIASYSQRSQRYTDFMDAVPVVIPPTIQEDAKLIEQYLTSISRIINDTDQYFYHTDIPAEDRRFLYPNAVATKVFFTMNARSLGNFFHLRLCHRAQWEIRYIASSMAEQLREHYPLLFNHKYFNRKCISTNQCTEKNPCVRSGSKEGGSTM